MKHIIFLDIDGVLNSDSWNAAHRKERDDGILIDRDKVALLAGLIRKTDAGMVLHSGWRFWFDNHRKPIRQEAARLTEMFCLEGLTLYDVTPDFSTDEIRRTKKFSLVKAREILSWLEMHPETERWIVLDDLDLHNDMVHRHQVQTDQAVGLTAQEIRLAEDMLLNDRNLPYKQ